MATDRRKKNADWRLNVNSDGTVPHNEAVFAVQMDIRDAMLRQNELLSQLVGLLRCHRIPRALDALHSLGVQARRRKRKARAAK